MQSQSIPTLCAVPFIFPHLMYWAIKQLQQRDISLMVTLFSAKSEDCIGALLSKYEKKISTALLGVDVFQRIYFSLLDVSFGTKL